MATVKGVIVVGVTIAAAAGVYFGLNKAFPKHVEHGQMPDITASADEVFSKSISESQPLPTPKAPPPTAPPTQIAQGEPPPVEGSAAPSSTPAPAPAPAPAEAAPAQPSAAPAPAPAEASKPAEPSKPASSSSAAMMVPEPGLTPAPTPKSTSKPAAEKPAAAPPPAPEKPAPTPKPAAEKPAPAPEKPAAAKPAPAPAPSAPAPATTAKKSAPAAETSARWWGDPKEQDQRRLNLSYVGQAAGKKGIALLFSGTFASAGVANWIKVTDASGKAAPGHWELGASPKMLVFAGISPGRYIVTLSPDLKDAQGKTLGRKLSGPVTVQ